MLPDLISKDGSFYVEVKASAYDNGGVINKRQLYKFDENIQERRFYAFAYHSINKNMQINYPTEKELVDALSFRSLFLFPISTVKAHFEISPKRKNKKHDDFVQLRESMAYKIFQGDEEVWKRLGLDEKDYDKLKLNKKIHIITREGNLEKKIVESFHPELM